MPTKNIITKDPDHRISRGFTLAELLIALLILVEIATFAIPKILYTVENQKKTAIFKETISTISGIFYQGYVQVIIKSETNGSYLMDRINAVKLCDTNATTQGCWTSGGPESTKAGIVLHNGAAITGLNDNGGTNNAFVLDWNGPVGNNIQGDDQIYFQMCYGSSSCVAGGNIISLGTIGPAGAANITLYQTIFQ